MEDQTLGPAGRMERLWHAEVDAVGRRIGVGHPFHPQGTAERVEEQSPHDRQLACPAH